MSAAKQLQQANLGESVKTRQYVLNNRRLLSGLRARNRNPEREEPDVV